LTLRPAGEGYRWQSQAIQALQEAAEAFLVHLFEDTKYVLVEWNVYEALLHISPEIGTY
jgi:hypothetical protein